MSGYAELRTLGVTFRPFEPPVPRGSDIPSPFDAPWSSTVETLARELRHLDARRIVIELEGLTEADLRIDGLPRANARLGNAVRISFESRWGPLRYETAEFRSRWRYSGATLEGWQSNLRAIALGMEALRKVDRYGVSKRGEQYRGWRQLTSGTDPADAIVTFEQARAVLLDAAGVVDPDGLGTELALDAVARLAIKRTHPDAGGDPDAFRKVIRAREITGA